MDASTGSVEGMDGVDEQLLRHLAERARTEGVRLTGEGGLLSRLTKVVFESALEVQVDLDDLVISLSAKGLTTGEISAHLAEIYGAQVSKQTISTITEKVVEGMAAAQNRPLDAVGEGSGAERVVRWR